MHHKEESLTTRAVLEQVGGLRDYLLTLCESVRAQTQGLNPSHQKSAKNLLHYVALRNHDIRPLQERLSRLGLSSLGRAEPHVAATLEAVYGALQVMAHREAHAAPGNCAYVGIDEGRSLLETRAEKLLGPKPSLRSTRVMVTLPPEAADNPELAEALLAEGMDCARINCAHDSAEAWSRMIAHLRAAEKKLGRACKILMDLGGPKLRTGPVAGVRIAKAHAERSLAGRVVHPAQVWLACEGEVPSGLANEAVLPVGREFISALKEGSRVRFQDARGMQRELEVVEFRNGAFRAECQHNCYILGGSRLELEESGLRAEVGLLPEVEEPLLLKPGALLRLTRSLEPGTPEQRDASGKVVREARIGCTLPQVFEQARPGDPVWFDDGKIGGTVRESHPDWMLVEITRARATGGKLRGDKGINFPESQLSIPALTEKDLRDLEFVAAHADMAGLSFVQNPEDVEALNARLKALSGRTVGVVLKIETQRAFKRLPDLLLSAMRAPLAGVMIARGDLAIECGFERLAEVQEEILWICEAAHMPAIWATQVLESAAKSGLPSRAEITDAAMSARAECVMLNKGPCILEALRILNGILCRMQGHQDKKRTLLRRLASWSPLAERA